MKLLSKLIVPLLISLGFTQQAASQDISWKLSKLKPGDYVAVTVKYKGGNLKDGFSYTMYTGKKVGFL